MLVVALPDAGQLRQLPGVIEVASNKVEKPLHRVVHLLNWHWIPADDAKLLDAADPVKDGKIEFNAEAARAREEGTSRLLLKQS